MLLTLCMLGNFLRFFGICIAQSVYACLTAIQALSHTFVGIDNEIISTVILLPSADCQLHAKVCERSTG